MTYKRCVAWIGILVVLAGCRENPMEEELDQSWRADPPMAAALLPRTAIDGVLLKVSDQAADGTELGLAFELSVEHLEDGVSVSFAPESNEREPVFRASESGTIRRSPPSKATLSLSQGTQLIDQQGQPIVIPESLWRELREAAGLPPTSSNPLTKPRAGGAIAQQAAPRLSRLITGERAQKELQDLRQYADAEERVGPTFVRFHSTKGGAAQSWLFDETIGTVVEHAIDREGQPRLCIRHEFERAPDGYVRIRSVSEWTEADGKLARRSEKVFQIP